VSLLDCVVLVCAPPELCTIPERGSVPERGSAVEASLGEEVELVWASTELCTIPDVERDEEPAGEADESVDDLGPVDDVPAADPEDGSEPDEADDELEEEESVGSANATPGVFATAAAAPSVTANTPTRTMHFALTGIAHPLAMRFPMHDSPSQAFCLECCRTVIPKFALPN